MCAISIWLSYGTILRSIKNLCIRGSQKSLYVEKYSLRWVPNTLNDDQKAVTFEIATSMLSILESLNTHARSLILTGDEPWLYSSYDRESKWTLARNSSMTKPKALINAPKIMVLVIWGTDGSVLLEIVPPNLCVNAK
jgi:hypothetical protein